MNNQAKGHTVKSVKHAKVVSSKTSQYEHASDDETDEGSTDDGARPKIKKSVFSMALFDAEKDLPIVYSANYNMSIIGMEVLHQFDTKKYGKLADLLSDLFADTQYARFPDEPVAEGSVPRRKLKFLSPNRPVNERELALHHSEDYLGHIFNDKSLIARITETWALNLVPLSVLENRVLTPIRWQVAGTIFALHLAMQHGWSINLGGGFHTASAGDGETFSIFSDIFIAIKYVWRKHPLQKFLIIDLDAHQATGLERDLQDMNKKKRQMIHILDMFNETVQPPDERALKGIDTKVELGRFTGDETYMKKLKKALDEAVTKFKPTVIVYVNGQDVLKDDQLGLLNLSDETFKLRDQMVFSLATETLRIPIVMLLGGGYLARGPKTLAESIRNLFAKGLIWGGHRSGSRSLSRPRRLSSDPKLVASKSNSKSKSKKSIKQTSVEPASKEPKPIKPSTSTKSATGRAQQ